LPVWDNTLTRTDKRTNGHGCMQFVMTTKINLDFDRKREFALTEGESVRFRLRDVAVEPGARVSLKKHFDPDFTGGTKDKTGAIERLASNVERMSELQEILYAQDVYSVLLVFQAMDAAGKDGAIRHVMSGVNPQGVHVTSFKAPSAEDIDHDYLWRAHRALPARGMIGIFNRSYYEEVLVVRVHKELLKAQRLPPGTTGEKIWERRFREINNFEKYLVRNGTLVLKFFLNISKDEQKKRFLARIDESDKNWKFSVADYRERGYWDQYQEAFEDMLTHTSTEWAPWFVIPADNKWFARLAISQIVTAALEGLDLKIPKVDSERLKELQAIREQLINE
jgi:PPK2 family polyphosphate:nucleotide phosphotransferase